MILYSIARCCCSCFGCGRGRAPKRSKKQAPWNPNQGVAMAPYPKPGEAGFAPNAMGNTRGFHGNEGHPSGQPLLSETEPAHLGQHRRNVSGSYSDDMGPGIPMRAGYTDPYAAGTGGFGHAVPGGGADWVDAGRYNGRDDGYDGYEQGHEYRYDEGIPRAQYDAHDARGHSRQ